MNGCGLCGAADGTFEIVAGVPFCRPPVDVGTWPPTLPELPATCWEVATHLAAFAAGPACAATFETLVADVAAGRRCQHGNTDCCESSE